MIASVPHRKGKRSVSIWGGGQPETFKEIGFKKQSLAHFSHFPPCFLSADLNMTSAWKPSDIWTKQKRFWRR